MSNEVVTRSENIKNTAAYLSALTEVQKRDIFAIFLDICDKEGLFQHARKVTAVQTFHQFVDAQELENKKTVEAKQKNNPWLDSCGVVCMFIAGGFGGQTTGPGQMFYAIGQGFEKTSGMKSQGNQGNVTAQEHKYRRYDNLVGDQSQVKQGSHKEFDSAIDAMRRAVDSYQRISEQAVAS